MKRHNSNATPLLVGTLVSNTLQVWCPYCKQYHRHGWDVDNADNDVEHRKAHCRPGSPFRESGYYIGVAPGA